MKTSEADVAIDDAPPAATGPIRVAIVEDDRPVREILVEWIRQAEGFVCVEQFADGEAAAAALPDLALDVVLVDINLPGTSGIELVRRLKPRRPQTQFVMLTVYDDSAHIFDALAGGATGYLLKRTPCEGLLAAVREVFAGGSPMSSDIARKVVQSLRRARHVDRESSGLSPREDEVLGQLTRGFLYKEIADAIGISLPTVKTYIRRICEKLHVHSRAQAVALFTHRPPPQDH